MLLKKHIRLIISYMFQSNPNIKSASPIKKKNVLACHANKASVMLGSLNLL